MTSKYPFSSLEVGVGWALGWEQSSNIHMSEVTEVSANG